MTKNVFSIGQRSQRLTQTMVTHTVTYLKMITHTVTSVSFHTALFNQESRKDFITITKISQDFPSRKRFNTTRCVIPLLDNFLTNFPSIKKSR